MILQSQISKLSNRLLKEQGGRRIPESVLERDYCIATTRFFMLLLCDFIFLKTLKFFVFQTITADTVHFRGCRSE